MRHMYRPEGRHFKEIRINVKVRAKIIYYSLYSEILPSSYFPSSRYTSSLPPILQKQTNTHIHTSLGYRVFQTVIVWCCRSGGFSFPVGICVSRWCTVPS